MADQRDVDARNETPPEVEGLRRRIDAIDDQLMKLLNSRSVTFSVMAQHLSGAVAMAACSGLKAGVLSVSVRGLVRPDITG